MKDIFLSAAALLLWAHIIPLGAATFCSTSQIESTGCCSGYSFKNLPPGHPALPTCPASSPPAAHGVTVPQCDGPPPVCTAKQTGPFFEDVSKQFRCGNENCKTSDCTGEVTVSITLVDGVVEVRFTSTGTLPSDIRFNWFGSPPTAPGDGPGYLTQKYGDCTGGVCTYTLTTLLASLDLTCADKLYFRAHHDGVGTNAGNTCRVGDSGSWPSPYITIQLSCKEFCSAYCCCPPPPPEEPCASPEYESCVTPCPSTDCDSDTCSVDSVFGQTYACTCCCTPPGAPPCDTGTVCSNPAPYFGCVAGNDGCHEVVAKDNCDRVAATSCCCGEPGTTPCPDGDSPCRSNARMRVRTMFGYDGLARNLVARNIPECPGSIDPVHPDCLPHPCSGPVDGCVGPCCCPPCTDETNPPPSCTAPKVGVPPTNDQCPANRDCTLESATLCDDTTAKICCCNPVPPGGFCGSETLYGNTCASPDPSKTCDTATSKLLNKNGCDANRWGWIVKGAPGSTFYLWSGAGKNDLTKGTFVGKATIGLCTDSAGYCITYVAGNGFAFSEVHVDATCGSILANPNTRNNGYPCAPGSYKPGPGGTCTASGPSKEVTVALPTGCEAWTLILHGVISTFSDPKPATCVSPC